MRSAEIALLSVFAAVIAAVIGVVVTFVGSGLPALPGLAL